MERRVNFADPEFEPTDEDLVRLSREAFAGVASMQAEALSRLKHELAIKRTRALAEFDAHAAPASASAADAISPSKASA